MKTTEFIVEGMSCQHCVQTVTKTLQAIDGVSNVQVDLSEKTAQLEYDESYVNMGDLFQAIEAVNFTPKKKT